MADIYDQEKRSAIMRKVRSRCTAPEEKVEALLKELDLKFSRNVKALPGSPDFVLDDYSVAVFVNGCFWHNHRNCPRAKLPKTNRDFWKHKILSNKKRDSKNVRQLHRYNYRVFTVWQCKLRQPEKVKSRLVNFLKKK